MSDTLSMCDGATNDKAITSRRTRNQTAVNPSRTMPRSDKQPSVESSSSSSRLGPIARLFSSSQRILVRQRTSSASDGQVVNEETAQPRHFLANRRSRVPRDSRIQSLTVHDVVRGGRARQYNWKEYHRITGYASSSATTTLTSVVTESTNRTRTGTTTSALDAAIKTTITGGSRQRKTAVYSRDFPVEGSIAAADCSATQFPSVENLIKMYATMLAERKSEFAEQKLRSKSEGESTQ